MVVAVVKAAAVIAIAAAAAAAVVVVVVVVVMIVAVVVVETVVACEKHRNIGPDELKSYPLVCSMEVSTPSGRGEDAERLCNAASGKSSQWKKR